MTERDLLTKIRGWFEEQLDTLQGDVHKRKTRRYLRQRIETINLLLMQGEEREYLEKLDARFLVNEGNPTTEDNYGDTADDFRDLCN